MLGTPGKDATPAQLDICRQAVSDTHIILHSRASGRRMYTRNLPRVACKCKCKARQNLPHRSQNLESWRHFRPTCGANATLPCLVSRNRPIFTCIRRLLVLRFTHANHRPSPQTRATSCSELTTCPARQSHLQNANQQVCCKMTPGPPRSSTADSRLDSTRQSTSRARRPRCRNPPSRKPRRGRWRR